MNEPPFSRRDLVHVYFIPLFGLLDIYHNVVVVGGGVVVVVVRIIIINNH